MGFAWVQNVGVGASIDAVDMNEIQINLDTIYTFLSITRGGCGAGAGWTELPVVADTDAIENVQLQQLRDVTDYAYDNRCQGYDAAANDAAHRNDDNSGYEDADLVGVDGTYYSSDLSTPHNSGYNASEHIGVDFGYESGYLDNDQKSVDAPYCNFYETVDLSSPHYVSNCGEANSPVYDDN